jgi:hypothetical protein
VRAGQINPDIKKDVEKVQQQLVARGLRTHPSTLIGGADSYCSSFKSISTHRLPVFTAAAV